MTVRLESVTFTSGDGETSVPSYLATPDRDGRHPVVLILRGVAGPDDGYTEIANPSPVQPGALSSAEARGAQDPPGEGGQLGPPQARRTILTPSISSDTRRGG
jgi:hypothetical protein